MTTWLTRLLCAARGHGGVAFGETRWLNGFLIFYHCKRCGADWKQCSRTSLFGSAAQPPSDNAHD